MGKCYNDYCIFMCYIAGERENAHNTQLRTGRKRVEVARIIANGNEREILFFLFRKVRKLRDI